MTTMFKPDDPADAAGLKKFLASQQEMAEVMVNSGMLSKEDAAAGIKTAAIAFMAGTKKQ